MAVKAHYIGHRQRLRERFIEAKKSSLPDYEILELILFMARPQGDVKPLAKELIATFGSFGKVINADRNVLMQINGVGETVISTFKLFQEVSARLIKEEIIEKPILESWKALLDYCRSTMGHITTEQFRVIYLDKKNMVIADDLQEMGTVDHTTIYPREIVKRALFLDASAVILVHNHPSGNTKPSKNDIEVTKSIVNALGTISVTLHDHVIISHSSYYSFKSNCLL